MPFFEPLFPKTARIYLSSVLVVGAAVFVYSLFDVLRQPPSWLYLAIATLFSGLFPVRLPFVRQQKGSLTLTVSDALIFTAMLMYSAQTAVLLSVLDGAMAAIRADRSRRPYRVLFNLSQLAASTFIVGQIVYLVLGRTPPLSKEGISGLEIFLALGLCALLHFFLNAGAVNLAVTLTTGGRFIDLFRQNFLWASLTTISGAVVAAIIFINFEETPVFAIAIAAPVLIVIYNAYKMHLQRHRLLHEHTEELNRLFEAAITSLAMAIDAKDHSQTGEVQKAAILCVGLAEKLGIHDRGFLDGLKAAAVLRDVGKLAVPEYILNKPGKLTDAEAARIRHHPIVGADILETIPFPYPVVPFVRHHHERWDGTGYPAQLRGEEIPLGARIIAVVDSYLGFRSDRPFRPRLSRELAVSLIRQDAGKAFDPHIVDVFLRHLDELEARAEAADLSGWAPGKGLQQIHLTAASHKKSSVFHDIASSLREMQAVYEISQNIGRSLNLQETLSYLGTRIRRFIPYSACSIYLVSAEEDRLIPHHVIGLHKETLEGVEIGMGEGVTGWVAGNRQSLLNVSPDLDFPRIEQLKGVFHSCLAVPLAAENRVVGVITLYSDRAGTYNDSHLRLLESISSYAAVAISNAVVYEETQTEAYTDALTGLPNLRYLNTFVPEELKRAKRVGYSISFLMLDLDDFKRINDRYGHPLGDSALREIARILRAQLRKSDVCIRYGGDEFVCVLPGLDHAGGQQIAERVRQSILEHPVVNVEGENVTVGVSIGLAWFPGDGLDLDQLMAKADQRMFQEKNRKTESRGQVVSFGSRPAGSAEEG